MGGNVRQALLATAMAGLLAGCGGGGSEDSTPEAGAPTSFAAYAAQDGERVASGALTPAQAAEVAGLSRTWAGAQLAAASGNAFVLPALQFARVETLAAAASGTTLAQLRAAFPAPSSSAVTDALLQGLQRRISAAAVATPTAEFMADVTARGRAGVWESLVLDPLSESAMAAQRDVRLSVSDTLRLQLAWPQAVPFDGVFEDAAGSRVLARMTRVTGPRKAWSAGGTQYTAMSLFGNRWLVRITPAAGPAWDATALQSAVSAAQAGVADAALGTTRGDLVLPLEASFSAAGTQDQRGMAEALDPRAADLRRLDGGGTFAQLGEVGASMQFKPGWLDLSGAQSVSFLYAAGNPFAGSSFQTDATVRFPVACGATSLRPAVLALLGAHGRVEMLARLSASAGTPCQN